jgi:F0F1-type ATP synthase epsilon subunit
VPAKCTLVSALEKKEFPEVQGIFVETITGQRGILPHHINIVAQLKDNSQVRIQTPEGELRFTIGRGSYFQFKDNIGIILTQEYMVSK